MITTLPHVDTEILLAPAALVRGGMGGEHGADVTARPVRSSCGKVVSVSARAPWVRDLGLWGRGFEMGRG